LNSGVYVFIALGGALGALGRYILSNIIHSRTGPGFPAGTFIVNILGCFLLGLVFILSTEKLTISANMRTFLSIGFLGAFTTFSTFSLETLSLIKGGEIKTALFNVLGSLIIGLLAVWLGTIVAQIITR